MVTGGFPRIRGKSGRFFRFGFALATVLFIAAAAVISAFVIYSGILASRRTQTAPATGDTSLPTTQNKASSTTQSGLETYRNEEYGFIFDYPKAWGEIELEQASAGDRSVNPVGLKRPDTGAIFVGKFSRNPGCSFGAITPNYSYGSEGPLIVSAGWVEKSNHYYTLWPDSSIRNLVSNRGPDELVPERVVTVASGTAQALILETPIEDFDDTVIVTVLKADINLPGPTFRGMALGCSLSPHDSPEEISEERGGVDVMLQSFGFTR